MGSDTFFGIDVPQGSKIGHTGGVFTDAALSQMHRGVHRKSEETVIRSDELIKRTKALLAQPREIMGREGRSPCEKFPENGAFHKRSQDCLFGDE